MKKKLILLTLSLIMAVGVYADIVVTGRVTLKEEPDEPAIGATVMIKGKPSLLCLLTWTVISRLLCPI